MATIERYRVNWTGFTGAPGISTFYYFGTIDPASALRAMFATIATWLPTSVTISFPTGGDTIDDTTGKVNGEFTASVVTNVVGTDPGAYAGASGACINWKTGAVINGHRVKGRTFLVPLGPTAYQTDGTLAATVVSNVRGAALTYLATTAGLAQVIYRRPGSPGGAGHVNVTGTSVPDKAIVLRSRRD